MEGEVAVGARRMPQRSAMRGGAPRKPEGVATLVVATEGAVSRWCLARRVRQEIEGQPPNPERALHAAPQRPQRCSA